MEKQRQNRYARSAKQVEEMRRLYSSIGQPLPADVIIDLCQHLGTALSLAEETNPKRSKKRRAQA